MKRSLSIAVIATVAACGGDKSGASRDTVGTRDSLVPIADQPVLSDTSHPAATPPETVVVVKPAPPPPPPPPAPRPRPRPSGTNATNPVPQPASPPSAPATASRPTVTSGTAISAVAIDTISSRVNKVGDVVRVRVASDVQSSDGRLVIPAGSIVQLNIVAIAAAPNRGDKGTLTMSARSIEINGTSYDITARANDYAYVMKARGVGAGEVAKTGAGAVAGGIIGRVVGGKTGTVVGAVGGAAAGAAVAAKTADRDIIVPAGNSVTLTLRDDFVKP